MFKQGFGSILFISLTLSNCSTQSLHQNLPPATAPTHVSKLADHSRHLVYKPLRSDKTFKRGLYLQQSTFINEKRFNALLNSARKYSINTFIVDLNRMTTKTRKHIQQMHQHNMLFIARVVIFPHGGTAAQVDNPLFWQRAWPTIQSGIKAGLDGVQLDYIRYRSDTAAHASNKRKILRIIQWYQRHLHAQKIPLQAALFGVTAFHPVNSIGQDIHFFANHLDVICPMVYPSHWEPQIKYGHAPYETVFSAIRNIKHTVIPEHPIAVIPYIEMSNYRIKHTQAETKAYITKQIQAATRQPIRWLVCLECQQLL